MKQYTQYLQNVGGSIDITKFDDDWEPIGPLVRLELCDKGLAKEENGVIILVTT